MWFHEKNERKILHVFNDSPLLMLSLYDGKIDFSSAARTSAVRESVCDIPRQTSTSYRVDVKILFRELCSLFLILDIDLE